MMSNFRNGINTPQINALCDMAVRSLAQEKDAGRLELFGYRKRELYELMSDISEECYCAGWMDGNEFRLWRAVTDPNDDRRYGQSEIEKWQLIRLRELSELTGGWWVWEDDAAFISLDEWRRRLAAIKETGER